MKARVALLLVAAGSLFGCGPAPARALRGASRDLGQAIARDDDSELAAILAPGYRDRVALDDPQTRRSWSRSLAKPTEIVPQAIVMLAPGVPVRAVWTQDGWRLADDPTELYRQDTPRHALRALVIASRHQRWDVLLGLAPERYRLGLTPEALEKAWSEGEQGRERQRARDAIAEHLADPIPMDAHHAILVIGPDHEVRLEREGDRWVVADFLPR